jgi:hypothetical protein
MKDLKKKQASSTSRDIEVVTMVSADELKAADE